MPALFPLFCLLLQVPTPSVQSVLVFFVPLAAVAFAVFSFFRRENLEAGARREGQALQAAAAVVARDERIKSLETRIETHELRFTGVVNEHGRHCDEVKQQFAAHKTMLADIQPIRENQIKTNMQLEVMAAGLKSMEVKIDALIATFIKPR